MCGSHEVLPFMQGRPGALARASRTRHAIALGRVEWCLAPQPAPPGSRTGCSRRHGTPQRRPRCSVWICCGCDSNSSPRTRPPCAARSTSCMIGRFCTRYCAALYAVRTSPALQRWVSTAGWCRVCQLVRAVHHCSTRLRGERTRHDVAAASIPPCGTGSGPLWLRRIGCRQGARPSRQGNSAARPSPPGRGADRGWRSGGRCVGRSAERGCRGRR
jgi:hypothetical protein